MFCVVKKACAISSCLKNSINLYSNRPSNSAFWPVHAELNHIGFGDAHTVLPSMWNAAKTQLTDFIFPSGHRQRFTAPVTTTTTTTRRPIITTTITLQSTTTDLPSWLKDVLNEQSTTQKISNNNPITSATKSTTIHPFWGEWSATKSTDKDIEIPKDTSTQGRGHNENSLQTTTKMPAWMEQVIDEYSTTTEKSTAAILPWMQDILNEYSTTSKPILNNNIQPTTAQSVSDMPSWMRDVLNEQSTKSVLPVQSTTKMTTNGDGRIGGGNGDLYSSTPNRYS